MAKTIVQLEGEIAHLNEVVSLLTNRVMAIEQGNGAKKRGPKTERSMTEEDAFRVKFGDLKPPISHKDAAAAAGLSYGQVFSCRGGYTFKHVKATWKPPVQTPAEGSGDDA